MLDSTIHALEGFLYHISTALYLPVIGACAGLTLYITLAFGIFLREGWERRRRGSSTLATYRRLLGEELARGGDHRDARLERLLQIAELRLAKSLDRVRVVIKVGPALGLMGTLIPMGISLAALAEGNIPKMAGGMVTAFTATVAGLGCGTAAYLIALKREKWAQEDVRSMEYLTEIAARTGKPDGEV